MSTGIRYEFAFGSYEDALQMVGVRSEPRFAGTAVSAARIQHFAAMVRDPNPAYWDEEFAKRVWGGFVAPPALLMGWLIPTLKPGSCFRRALSFRTKSALVSPFGQVS